MKTSKNAFLKFIIGYIQSDTDPRGAYNNPENISIPITAIKPPCLNHLCNCDKRILKQNSPQKFRHIQNQPMPLLYMIFPTHLHLKNVEDLPNK